MTSTADPIATVREERDLVGRIVSVECFDAAGAPCARVEYDTATGRPVWVNLRDDVAAARPDLAAMRAELLEAPACRACDDAGVIVTREPMGDGTTSHVDACDAPGCAAGARENARRLEELRPVLEAEEARL